MVNGRIWPVDTHQHTFKFYRVQQLRESWDACQPHQLEHDAGLEHEVEGKYGDEVDVEPAAEVLPLYTLQVLHYDTLFDVIVRLEEAEHQIGVKEALDDPVQDQYGFQRGLNECGRVHRHDATVADEQKHDHIEVLLDWVVDADNKTVKEPLINILDRLAHF
jgi:hypothetical protein